MTEAGTRSRLGQPIDCEQRLRVLLVNGNYEDGTQGGTQVFTRHLARWLSNDGHEVGVLCLGERDSVEQTDRVRVYRMRPPGPARGQQAMPTYVVNQCLAIHNPAVAPKVRQVLRDFQPDLCHLQMLRRLTPAVISAVTAHGGVALVQTVHELFSLWNFNPFQRTDSPGKIWSRRPRGVGLFKYLHRRLSRRVHHVCAPSEFALRSYVEDGYFAGVPATIIPNAVPHEWGPPRVVAARRRQAQRSHTAFLFIGRLDYHKGVQELLAAMDLLHGWDLQLHIAGVGVMERAVRDRASRDARVTFHGPVDGRARRELFLQCDVLVAPSTWVETFGLVVLEAFAAGMPCIVSQAGALAELVDAGRTGLVVSRSSAGELADAMGALCDARRRQEMLPHCAEKAMAHPPGQFLRQQLDVYRAAISRVGVADVGGQLASALSPQQ